MIDVIESFGRRKEREDERRKADMKDHVLSLYNQALQIGNIIGKIFKKDLEILPPSSYYPDLFAEEIQMEKEEKEEEDEDESQKLSPEMQLYKARMENFVHYHNMRIQQKQREQTDGRNDA